MAIIIEDGDSGLKVMNAINEKQLLDITLQSADTPDDADLLSFWQILNAVRKKVTFANLKSFLKTYFDTNYAGLSMPTLTIKGNDTLITANAKDLTMPEVRAIIKNIGDKEFNQSGLTDGSIPAYDLATDKFVISTAAKIVTIGTGGTYTTLKGFLENLVIGNNIGVIISDLTETQNCVVYNEKYVYNTNGYTITYNNIQASESGIAIGSGKSLNLYNCKFSFATITINTAVAYLITNAGYLNLYGTTVITGTGTTAFSLTYAIYNVGWMNAESIYFTPSYSTSVYKFGRGIYSGGISNIKYLYLNGVNIQCSRAFEGTDSNVNVIDVVKLVGTWHTAVIDAASNMYGFTANKIVSAVGCQIGNTNISGTPETNVKANIINIPLGHFGNNFSNNSTKEVLTNNEIICNTFMPNVGLGVSNKYINVNNFYIGSFALYNFYYQAKYNFNDGTINTFNNNAVLTSNFNNVIINTNTILKSLQNGSIFTNCTFLGNLTIDSTCVNIIFNNCKFLGNLTNDGTDIIFDKPNVTGTFLINLIAINTRILAATFGTFTNLSLTTQTILM